MKLKVFVILVFFIVAFSYSFAQSKLEFVDVKDLGNSKTVYFQVKGLGEDDESRALLLNDLLSDPKVIDGRIFTSSSFKTRVQLFIPHDVEPEYIRPILQAHGYDFEFSSVSIDGQLLIRKDAMAARSIFHSPAEDYPQYVKTGDKELDAENYRLAKEQWIENNKRKYKKQKLDGTAEYPIVISQEQFDNFTDEKKEKVISHPDMFEIR